MHNYKILVVDDEKDLRDALCASLKSAGYLTFEASDGTGGLARALHEKPDLILLDIMMPNMTGIQVLHELRKDPWGKRARVLLLTNADDATNISHAAELKGNDYIIKSQTSLKDITKIVKQHLVGYHN